MDKIDKVSQGKANRRKGAEFERKTRKWLEKKGFIVDKWTNNIDLEEKKIIPAKANPFNRFNRSGAGFPDFVAFIPSARAGNYYNMIFVECKTNGKLSKIEKQKMNFLMSKGHTCWLAFKGEDREVVYNRLQPFKFKK